MTDEPDAIKESLKPLIAEARASGKFLWCSYQDIWFSPDDLARQNDNGKFLWGPVNWRLRDPQERITELQHATYQAQVDLDAFRSRFAGNAAAAK